MRPFEEILAIDSAAAFDCAALELFRFQAERCGVYREYLAEIGVDPAAVRRVDEIPMLPIEFFKWRDVYCGDTEPQIVFTSSNTGPPRSNVSTAIRRGGASMACCPTTCNAKGRRWSTWSTA